MRLHAADPDERRMPRAPIVSRERASLTPPRAKRAFPGTGLNLLPINAADTAPRPTQHLNDDADQAATGTASLAAPYNLNSSLCRRTAQARRAFFAASATTVAPPPLPMGSAMAKPQVGASPTEEKRAEKAHKQPSVLRRNHLHDDSLAPPRQGAIPRATVSVPRDSK